MTLDLLPVLCVHANLHKIKRAFRITATRLGCSAVLSKGMCSLNKKSAIILCASILGVQALDVAIHVATNQVEPVRILSNVVISLWALIAVARLLGTKLGWVAIAVYAILNGLFLAENGLTNPEQGDAPRVTLFVLVIVSVWLSVWLMRNRARQ